MHTEMERLSFLAVSYVIVYDYHISLKHWYSDLTRLHIHDLKMSGNKRRIMCICRQVNFYVACSRNLVYRVSQEECEILRESVPYVELYRYSPKHLHPKLNGYGDNGQRSLKL